MPRVRDKEHVFRCYRCKKVFPSLDIHLMTTCPTCGGVALRVWGIKIDWAAEVERRKS